MPLSFKWFKNEQELLRHTNPNLSYQIKTDNFLSFLTISQLKASDYGNYSCVVSNPFGFDIQWTWLQVKGSFFVFDHVFGQNAALLIQF